VDFGRFRKRVVVTRLQALKIEFHCGLSRLIVVNSLLLLLFCWALTPDSYIYITFIRCREINCSQLFILYVYLMFHSSPWAIDWIFRAITIDVLKKSRIVTWFVEKPESIHGNCNQKEKSRSYFTRINLLRWLFAGSKFDLWKFMVLWVKKNYYCELSMYGYILTEPLDCQFLFPGSEI